DEEAGAERAEEDQHGDREREQARHHAGDAPGLLLASLGEEARIDGDERRREDALAEEVLEEVRDAQRRLEGAGGVRAAEGVRGDARADEAGDAREEDAGGDRQRGEPAGHVSSNLSSPSFSRLQAILSPGLSQTRWSAGLPWITPSGVPVKMTSPGRKVICLE